MKKILIIEDEPLVRRTLRDVLEMAKFKTLLAADGLAGLATARCEVPDLILSDVLMPGLDGHELLAALRTDTFTARIPFIFLTAKGEDKDVRTGMNLGADDYLIKPVGAFDLLKAITMRLERAQQQTGFKADFSSAAPLEQLGLSRREAEILLWVAQGKTNLEIANILNIAQATVKKHLEKIYPKLGVDCRNAATIKAVEALGNRAAQPH